MNQKLKKSRTSSETPSNPQMVEVLYQKMGSRWYAFSLIDDEVFYGAIDAAPAAKIASSDAAPKKRRATKISGSA